MRNDQYWKDVLLTVDGRKLTEARLTKGVTLDDVASALNCNKSSISRWEQEILIPSSERLWKLVDIYGTISFIRLNFRAKLSEETAKQIRALRPELVTERWTPPTRLRKDEIEKLRQVLGDDRGTVVTFLNREAELTAEEIEAIKAIEKHGEG